MFDEFALLRMLGGGIGSGLDVTALIAFLGFSRHLLIIPVIGYGPRRSTGIAVSLNLLIVYAGLSLLQMLVQWIQILDTGGPFGGGGGRGMSGVHVMFIFPVLKIAVFMIAMITFATGLRSIQLRRSEGGDIYSGSGPMDEMQALRDENLRLRRKMTEGGRGDEGIHGRF